ncbi:hypothetical protein ACFX2I_013518 [Malus domestica]
MIQLDGVRANRRWAILDTEPAHCTLRATESLTANSSDRLASSLLSLGVTRFLATTAAVISFFITESPTVRGPVEDMKDGCHMLSREGGTAYSPRFKSKRRSEGPDIFRGVKERRGRTSQDRRSARREFLQAEIQICPHLSHATSALNGISEIKEAIPDIREASAFPDIRVNIYHMHTQPCRNYGQSIEDLL